MRIDVGSKVLWTDGSFGKTVGPAEWKDQQWYYPVSFIKFPDEELVWDLPESGLEVIESVNDTVKAGL